MFSFLSMYSQRISSAISTLLTEGRAAKSKVSSVLMVGKRGRLDPPLGRPLLPFEQLQLGQAQEVGEMIGVVRGGLGGHLLALGRHRRETEGLEVVVQEHHGLGLCCFHGVAPFVWRVAPAVVPREAMERLRWTRCPNLTWGNAHAPIRSGPGRR